MVTQQKKSSPDREATVPGSHLENKTTQQMCSSSLLKSLKEHDSTNLIIRAPVLSLKKKKKEHIQKHQKQQFNKLYLESSLIIQNSNDQRERESRTNQSSDVQLNTPHIKIY